MLDCIKKMKLSSIIASLKKLSIKHWTFSNSLFAVGFILLMAGGYYFVWLLSAGLGSYIQYAEVTVKVALLMLVMWLADRYVFTEIDFIQEVKNGNIAVSTVYSAYVLIIGYLISLG